MKNRLIVILCAVFALTCFGQPQFGNVQSGWYGDALPVALPTTINPTLRQYQQAGYRYVTVIDVPAQTNLIATSYNVVDLNGTNCELTIKTTFDWVAAAAQAASNRAAAYTANLSALSNQVQQVMAGSNSAYALDFSYGYYIATCMAKSGVTNSMAAATNAIIQKAFGRIQ